MNEQGGTFGGVVGGLKYQIVGMKKIMLHCPMDYAKTLKLRFRDLDLL